jgi:hypothetical protein
VAAARRVPAFLSLYEHAGGDLHQAQQRNYAKVHQTINPLTATEGYISSKIVSFAYSKYVSYIYRGVKNMEKFDAKRCHAH